MSTIIRYNPFNQIHKGLRALLYDTAIKLQHTDFKDESAAASCFDRINTVLWLFDSHADIEDNMVFPLVKKVAHQVVKDFEKEHDTDHQLGNDLRNALQSYYFANDEDAKFKTGTNVLIAFNEFIAFNLSHMNREETIINTLLWENYSDEELMGVTKAIVAKIPQNKNELYSRWMLKGIGMHEIIDWAKSIKATAPQFVFEQFCFMAEEELPFEKWIVLKTVLGIEDRSEVAA